MNSRILRVCVDGYKNIVQSQVRFDERAAVLLASSNCGKSNLIESLSYLAGLMSGGIQEVHSLLTSAQQHMKRIGEGDEEDRLGYAVELELGDELVVYTLEIMRENGISFESVTVDGEVLMIRDAYSMNIGSESISIDPFMLSVSIRFLEEKDIVRYFEVIHEAVSGFYQVGHRYRTLNDAVSLSLDLYKSNRDVYATVLESFIRSIPNIHAIVLLDTSTGLSCGAPCVRVEQSKGEFKISFNTLSDLPESVQLLFYTGQKVERFVGLSKNTQKLFLSLLELATVAGNSSLILIDNFAGGLYPKAQLLALECMYQLCSDIPVLFSSNSDTLVNLIGNEVSKVIGAITQEGVSRFSQLSEFGKKTCSILAEETGTSVNSILFNLCDGSYENNLYIQDWQDKVYWKPYEIAIR